MAAITATFPALQRFRRLIILQRKIKNLLCFFGSIARTILIFPMFQNLDQSANEQNKFYIPNFWRKTFFLEIDGSLVKLYPALLAVQ